MEMVKMLKILIYPDDEDKALLIDSMHAYVAGCNYVSEYVFSSKDLSSVSVLLADSPRVAQIFQCMP